MNLIRSFEQFGVTFLRFLNFHHPAAMWKSYPCFRRLILFTLLLLLSTLFIHSSQADVGTAAQYGPPFLPTACFGRVVSQFPSNNMFGAAGEGIWDNGAACGRQYQVRCISAAAPRTCIPGQDIQIKIVDRAQSSVSTPSVRGTTIVLSTTAFQAIANASASLINVEFQQV